MTPKGEDRFNVGEEAQEALSKEREEEITHEMVEKKTKELNTNLIPKEEVDVKEDKYHTFHKICNTDLEFPSRKKQDKLT